MQEDYFEKNYYALYQLLGMFAGYADMDVFDEDVLIQEYLCNNRMLQLAKHALKQAEEVLKLEPFPEDLIRDLTNRTHNTRTRKQWLEGVVEILWDKIKEMESQTQKNNQKEHDLKASR